MEMSDSMAVSVSGLDAHRRRLNVIASNLANAQSTKTPTAVPTSGGMSSFTQRRFQAHFMELFDKSPLGRRHMRSKGSPSLESWKIPNQVNSSMILIIRMRIPKGSCVSQCECHGRNGEYDRRVACVRSQRASHQRHTHHVEQGTGNREVIMNPIYGPAVRYRSDSRCGPGSGRPEASGGSGFMGSLKSAIGHINDAQLEPAKR